MKKDLTDINPQNVAYLEDRVNMYHNKHQQYGTQFREDSDTRKLKLYKISDIDTVNKARKSIGLNTLEKYISQNGV